MCDGCINASRIERSALHSNGNSQGSFLKMGGKEMSADEVYDSSKKYASYDISGIPHNVSRYANDNLPTSSSYKAA